ncbi:hypothetical protein IAT38_001238 [Cryptococcus sp. DSM 104549]
MDDTTTTAIAPWHPMTAHNPYGTEPMLSSDELYHAWFGPLHEETQRKRHDYTTPTTYPPYVPNSRLNYEPTSYGAIFDQHVMRHVQQDMWMTLVMAPDSDMNPALVRMKTTGILMNASEKLPKLEEMMARAEKEKNAANRLYLGGKYQQAVGWYYRAWGNVLPFYPEAFPRGDPRRQKLGCLVAIIFANISAASVTLATSTKPAPHPRLLKVYRQQAFKCAWIALEQRLRAAEYVGYLHCDDPTGESAEFEIAAQTFSAYCKKQAAALVGVPKDTLYKDIEAERVVPRPEPAVVLLVGPQAWTEDLLFLGDLVEIKESTEAVEPRELTTEELWMGHSRLPQWALRDPKDDKIPKDYPEFRLTYSLHSPAQDVDLHRLRQMKIYIVESFWRARAKDDTGEKFGEHMCERVERIYTDHSLPGMIDDAEAVLDGVYFVMRGDPTRMVAAPGLLADCYISLLPAHVDAFAADDPLRARLGQVDTTIWSEMAYCASALGVQREEEKLPGAEVLFQQAARCAWLTLLQRRDAKVGAVRSACGISLLMGDKGVWQGCDKAQLGAMQLYWERQLVALDGLDDKAWFKDLDTEKRIQMPDIQRERAVDGRDMWVCAWDDGVLEDWPFVARRGSY